MVEGAALEKLYGGNSIVGSNPTLSATGGILRAANIPPSPPQVGFFAQRTSHPLHQNPFAPPISPPFLPNYDIKSTSMTYPVFPSSPRKKKVIVVMPAYNAGRTLEKTYRDLPEGLADDVILVDDGSRDDTASQARKLGLKTFTHPQNRGYGGNQKTCYTLALDLKGDVIVMIHPDYQYDPRRTPRLIAPVLDGEYDIMLGSRIRTRQEALSGGMPLYKYLGNRLLTLTENIVLGQALSEYHTGFRAYSARVLRVMPFHKFSDDFVFDQEVLIWAIRHHYRVGEIPVPVKYFSEASSINLSHSLVYGLSTLMKLIIIR